MPGHTALSAEIIVSLSRIEAIPPGVHKTRRSVEEQVSRNAVLHEGVVNRQKLATFVEKKMTSISVLGNTHAKAPLHFGGIQSDLLYNVRDLIPGLPRLCLLIFVRMRLRTMASTVRRDRARAGIPGESAGLKGAASARAEILRLVGVVLLLVFTLMWAVVWVRLVAA